MGADTLTKRCIKCKKEKPLGEFYVTRASRNKHGVKSECKACTKIVNAAWRKNNPRKFRNQRYKYNHGVSLEEVEKLIEKQGGRCAICKEKPSGKGTRGQLQYDHCHTTGQHRGMLCGDCNTSLGLMGDDTSRLRAAIKYLERSKREDSIARRRRVSLSSQCELRI